MSQNPPTLHHLPHTSTGIEDDPLWYKDAIIYELHVRAFHDANGDGIGDFQGLIEKLDYLQDLGVTAVWLLPFYPSPLRDDGYDTADYTDVQPAYGNLRDFRKFLQEAHARGIRVITELVINHTSSEHPWFQRARRSPPNSKYRNYYVWSDTPDRYQDARIIFQDFEASNWSWDPVAKAYYWHRFYSHQPDLNFENPDVHKEVTRALDFWMEMGVDGMRLDAIPYLFEREGTNCENLPETHAYLKQLRKHVDDNYRNRMFLAEANQWPEDAAAYFSQGDECHMNFHFPLMPRMFMAVQLENTFPILDILEQTPEIPENCQWALFLRNHDELTLEMVTDEDRDFMYRIYATDPLARINLGIRRRLAPLLGGTRAKVELMNGLLFSLPGTPVIYYGDEIGMGDNFHLGDRDGVRTPMQWSADRNAGFSRANPQRLYLPVIIDPEYRYEAINVEAQQNNPSSLLWWMKRIIALRKQHKVFGRGKTTFLRPDNNKVLAFVRSLGDEHVLVVANLSRSAQPVALDLGAFQGMVPVEMFGRSEFPRIGGEPYFLSMGPYTFHWFQLQAPSQGAGEAGFRPLSLEAVGTWSSLLTASRPSPRLGGAVSEYMRRRRWFRGKARIIAGAAVADAIPIRHAAAGAAQAGKAEQTSYLAFIDVQYARELPETYVVPMAFAEGDRAAEIEREHPETIIARVRVRPEPEDRDQAEAQGVIYEPVRDASFLAALLELFSKKKARRGQRGELAAETLPLFRATYPADPEERKPRLLSAEQSNTSVVFGERFMFKLSRVIEASTRRDSNPDVEIGRFLTEHGFTHAPPLAGVLTYHLGDSNSAVGVLQTFVRNQGDAWKFTLDMLSMYLERALSVAQADLPPTGPESLVERAFTAVPDQARETIERYLPMVEILGERTAEMHLALAAGEEDTPFEPEPFSRLYQRSLYQAVHTELAQTFDLLRRRRQSLPDPTWQALADDILARQKALDDRLRQITGERVEGMRIRIHGDYHLGQVLYTGNDFMIIDFEGEPARTLGERRIKRTPLRDVAGMLRSFHYAVATALRDPALPGDERVRGAWMAVWRGWVSAAFLGAYLRKIGGRGLLPADRRQQELLLDFMLIEKCVYELRYELDNRPDWVWIPMQGLRELAGKD